MHIAIIISVCMKNELRFLIVTFLVFDSHFIVIHGLNFTSYRTIPSYKKNIINIIVRTMDANVLMTEFILLQLFIFDDKQENQDL